MTHLADLLDQLAADLATEVDRLIARDPATPVGRLVALATTLRHAAESERTRSRRLPTPAVASLGEWARARGVSQATAKRHAARGLIAGAVRVQRVGWVVLVPGGRAGATPTGHDDEEQG